MISALWAMGGFVPAFYHIVAKVIPGTMYFRAPSTIMFETAFAFAALAALGVERLRAGEVGRRFLVGAWIAVAFVTLLGVSGVLSNAFANLASTLRGYPNFEPNFPNVTLGAWRMFFFGALALAIITAVALKRVPLKTGVLGLALVIVVDLWSVERQYWQFSPRAAQIYGSDRAIEAIKSDSIPGRVFTLATSNDAAYRDPFLSGDAMMSNAVRNVTGYHGNELDRYQYVYGGSWQGVLERLANSPAFPALTNLRWIYATSPTLPENMFPRHAKETPVLGPVTNAVGSKVWLYRVPGDNPPAWIVPALVKVPGEQALNYLMTTDFPIRSLATVDPESPLPTQQLSTPPAALPIRARVSRYAPGAIDVELDAPAPDKSALVVSENFYPGWKATVDGQPALVDRADFVIMAVALKAGARKIELRFTDAAYSKGKTITLLALVLAALAAVAGIVLERRSARA